MRPTRLLYVASLAAPALAAPPERELCSARPGLNSPTCTVEPGHFQVETAAVDFTRERDADSSAGTLLLADTVIRIGVTGSSEAQVAWTPHVRTRVRDRATGAVTRHDGAGDLTLGWSRALRSGDHGPSLAITASLSLPVGRRSVSAGTWGLATVLPVSFDLNDDVALNVTPEIDAAPDGDGTGRHFAYGVAAGLTFALASSLALNAEAGGYRDEDPSGESTSVVASASLARTIGRDTAFDVGLIVGLDRSAPHHEIYAGFTHRF